MTKKGSSWSERKELTLRTIDARETATKTVEKAE